MIDNKTKYSLVLASASPRRLELLKQVGIVPALVEPANIDETPRNKEIPKNLALRLAKQKLDTVANKYPKHWTLAADTLVTCGRRVLSKPLDEADARKKLEFLSGRRHRVITSVCVLGPLGKFNQRCVTTRVLFKRLHLKEIEFYIATGEWRGKAGAYGIQGQGARFIQSINGSYSNVVGLPLFETCGMLEGMGFKIQSN
ncbi:MAG: septum formation protein Maf [Rhodospirillaceae bacterium]|nr:septum formation protein Maf [Rhodospirillaceae bacterium]